jgi:hypothetical protein
MNEFKKIKNNNETRYVLETMTAGATGSGSIATATGSLGKVQKRGNILAQEAGKDKVPATTPRNFVAKNAKSSGAGAHKDKKKEQKQGAAKHKKPYMESLRTKIDQLKSKLAEQGVAEGVRDLGYDAQSLIMKLRRDVEEKRLQPTPQAVLAAARELAGDMEFAPQLLVKQVLGQGVAEGSGANKTYLAMAYLKAVVMAPTGTPDNERIRNWQEKLEDEFDIEMDTVTLAQMLPQFDSQLQSGNLDKLQNRMAGRGELEIGESDQGVAEAPEDRTSYQVAKILSDRGIKYDPAQENELINAIGMVLVKELNMTPREARNLISYDEDFVSDTLGELRSMEQSVSEVAPPGWEKTVKAMKKHDNIDNPFALAWSMKNKGYKSHKKESADPYFESLRAKVEELAKK